MLLLTQIKQLDYTPLTVREYRNCIGGDLIKDSALQPPPFLVEAVLSFPIMLLLLPSTVVHARPLRLDY